MILVRFIVLHLVAQLNAIPPHTSKPHPALTPSLKSADLPHFQAL